MGLSPRLRGNHRHSPEEQANQRSIPALAGEPVAKLRAIAVKTVYPRACGGTGGEAESDSGEDSLSPRLQGNPVHTCYAVGTQKSIPALAGKPLFWECCRRFIIAPDD